MVHYGEVILGGLGRPKETRLRGHRTEVAGIVAVAAKEETEPTKNCLQFDNSHPRLHYPS